MYIYSQQAEDLKNEDEGLWWKTQRLYDSTSMVVIIHALYKNTVLATSAPEFRP